MEGSYYRNHRGIVGGFGCDELVLYCIRVLAEQLLGTVLDIEVDQSVSAAWLPCIDNY